MAYKIICGVALFLVLFCLPSCKKNKFIESADAGIELSQDSVLFDTVFTSIGSSTRNFRIRNTHDQKIRISSISLVGGAASPFKINVDGVAGTTFNDIEIAANDSMYVFVQVKIDPTNNVMPMIVSDQLRFLVNGTEKVMPLEAWGQDAYYHLPDSAIHFKDGSYLAFSRVNTNKASYTFSGSEYTWKNDKPHVVYGYLVVDEKQKLKIPAGTKVFMNYKAGLWVYAGGQLQVLGQKGNEVIFQGARRERDYLDEPGQWDRIWINEGSTQNIINYAIIKNGYIGVQAELTGDSNYASKRVLNISNTKIQNMSLWGLYGLAYQIVGYNNVISNCQEHSLNVQLGGGYSFVHCTFANYWNKQKSRDKSAVNINNYTKEQVYPLYLYMGNSIVDGKLENELNLDLKEDAAYQYTYTINNSWLKTTTSTTNTARFQNIRLGDKNNPLKYKDEALYDFSPGKDETRYAGFVGTAATADAILAGPDITGKARNTTSVTAGAYELP